MPRWRDELNEMRRRQAVEQATAQAEFDAAPLERRLPPIRESGIPLTDVNRFDVVQPAIDAQREKKFAAAVQGLPPIQRANVEAAQTSMEPGISDYAHEYGMYLHPKNVVQRAGGGLMSGMASGAAYVADKLPNSWDTPYSQMLRRQTYQSGQSLIDEATPRNPALQNTLVGETIPSALSSVGEFVTAGAVAGLLGAAGLGSAEQVGSEYAQARSMGASEDVALSGTPLNAVIGATQFVTGMGGKAVGQAVRKSGNKIFGRVVAATDKAAAVAETLAGKKLTTVVGKMAGPAAEAFQEGILQQLPTNIVAQNTYDPARKTWEGVGTSMAVGAGARGVVDVGTRGLTNLLSADVGRELAIKKGQEEGLKVAEQVLDANEGQSDDVQVSLTPELLQEEADEKAKVDAAFARMRGPQEIPPAAPGMDIDPASVPGGTIQPDIEGQIVLGRRISGTPFGPSIEQEQQAQPDTQIAIPAQALSNLVDAKAEQEEQGALPDEGNQPQPLFPVGPRIRLDKGETARPAAPVPFGEPVDARRPAFMGRQIGTEQQAPQNVQGGMTTERQPWQMTRQEWMSETGAIEGDKVAAILPGGSSRGVDVGHRGVKSPWFNTQEEARDWGEKHGVPTDQIQGEADIHPDGSRTQKWRVTAPGFDPHRSAVGRAIKEDKSVPTNVLADYPDLKPSTGVMSNEVPTQTARQEVTAPQAVPETATPGQTETQPGVLGTAQSENEAAARQVGDSPTALRKRLQEAKSVLARQSAKDFGKGTFDPANKQLVSDDGTWALRWSVRTDTAAPESYENQQTNTGTVTVGPPRMGKPAVGSRPPNALNVKERVAQKPSEPTAPATEEHLYKFRGEQHVTWKSEKTGRPMVVRPRNVTYEVRATSPEAAQELIRQTAESRVTSAQDRSIELRGTVTEVGKKPGRAFSEILSTFEYGKPPVTQGASNAIQVGQTAQVLQGVREQPKQDEGQVPKQAGGPEVREAQEGQVTPSRTDTPEQTGFVAGLDRKAKEVRARRAKDTQSGKLPSGFDVVRDMADLAIVGADYIVKGARTVADFTEKLVREFGESARTHAGKIFQAAQDHLKGQPWYYSKLEDTLFTKMPNRASVSQIRSIIKDVPQDELKWTGLDEWLAGKTAITGVSKQEVLDFVRQNAITVTEKQYGGSSDDTRLADATARYDRALAELDRYPYETKDGLRAAASAHMDWKHVVDAYGYTFDLPDGREKVAADLKPLYAELEAAREAADTIRDESTGTSTRFGHGKLVLPGGENYRELLLTLPPKQLSPLLRRLVELEYKRTRTRQPLTEEDWSEINHLREQLGTSDSQMAATQAEALTGDFRSVHFPELNILAHVRFNERTDKEGKKVLFVEEVQSDWHEQGRDWGYAADSEEIVAGLKVESVMDGTAQQYYRIVDKDGNFVTHVQPHDLQDMRQNVSEENALAEGRRRVRNVSTQLNTNLYNRLKRGIPDAPFKKNWHELVMKRVLRYAVENGYDRVAWTTGEQQNERYNLSNYVDSIHWSTKDTRLYGETRNVTLMVRDSGDVSFIVHKDGVIRGASNSELDGRSLSEAVGQDIADRIMGERSGESNDLATDFKVGGSGMKGFYDKMIPNFMSSYTKKWGGKVGTTEITIPPPAHGEDIQSGPATVHSVDITPSMRESVMQGQPLVGSGVGSVVRAAQTEQARAKATSFFTEEKKNAAIARIAADLLGGKPRSFLGVPVVSAETIKDGSYLAAHYAQQILKQGVKAVMTKFNQHLEGFRAWMKENLGEKTFNSLDRNDRRGVNFFADALAKAVLTSQETKALKESDRRDVASQLRGFRFGKQQGKSFSKARTLAKSTLKLKALPIGFDEGVTGKSGNPVEGWKSASMAARLKMMSDANAKSDRATLPSDIRDSIVEPTDKSSSKFLAQFKTARDITAVMEVLSDFRKSVKEFEATRSAEHKAGVAARDSKYNAAFKQGSAKVGLFGRAVRKIGQLEKNIFHKDEMDFPKPTGMTKAILSGRASFRGLVAHLTRSMDNEVYRDFQRVIRGDDAGLHFVVDLEQGEIILRRANGLSDSDVSKLDRNPIDIGLSLQEKLSPNALKQIYQALRQESQQKRLEAKEDVELDEDEGFGTPFAAIQATKAPVLFVRASYAKDKSKNFEVSQSDYDKIKAYVEGHPYLKGTVDLFDRLAKKLYPHANEAHKSLTGNELGYHEFYHMLSRATEQGNLELSPLAKKGGSGWGALEDMGFLKHRDASNLPIKIFDSALARDFAYLKSMGNYAFKAVPGRDMLEALHGGDSAATLSKEFGDSAYNRLIENIRVGIGQVGPRGMQSLTDVAHGLQKYVGKASVAILMGRPGPIVRQLTQGLPQMMQAVPPSDLKYYAQMVADLRSIAADYNGWSKRLADSPNGYVRLRNYGEEGAGHIATAANPYTDTPRNKFTDITKKIKDKVMAPIKITDKLLLMGAVHMGELKHGKGTKAAHDYAADNIRSTQNAITEIDTPEILRNARQSVASPVFMLAGSGAKATDAMIANYKFGNKAQALAAQALSIVGSVITTIGIAGLLAKMKDDETIWEFMARVAGQALAGELGDMVVPGVGGDVARDITKSATEGRIAYNSSPYSELLNLISASGRALEGKGSSKNRMWNLLNAAGAVGKTVMQYRLGTPFFPVEAVQSYRKPKATLFGRRL